jgi:hypothetical protein
LALEEQDVLAFLDTCSNQGRWGEGDERGTLNFISADLRVSAARLITEGRVVSLERSLERAAGVSRVMLDPAGNADITCMDEFTIACHGLEITHLDAIGHMFIEGRMYNGRRVADQVSPAGLGFADVAALGPGIFTRGVLLDVARVHDVPWLEAGYGVTPDDLMAAEALAGVTVGRGDAIFVHVGADGQAEGAPGVRTGLTPACLPWLFEREVAIYSGDCTEQLPSGYQRIPYPLHQIGFAAIGLVLLDNPWLAGLVAAGHELGRAAFALTCAPLALKGATGSPVSPMALF